MPSFDLRGRRFNNPVELAQDVIGGKWKMPILWRLRAGTWRYTDLKKDLGRISHKMLAEQLRELERDGLVTRTVFPEVPPRVEYALTPRGASAVPLIEALREWGRRFREEEGSTPPRAARR